MRLRGIPDSGLRRIAQEGFFGDVPDVVYHVTYYRNLDGISEEGLLGDVGGGVGQGAGYSEHSKQGVFTTTWDGLLFWYSRSEDWGQNELVGDEQEFFTGTFPVVLAVRTNVFEGLKRDEIGTRDAFADAWIVDDVDPEEVFVWNGERWVPLEDWDTIDPEKAFDREETGEIIENEFSEHYGEPEVLYWQNDYLMPDHPLEERRVAEAQRTETYYHVTDRESADSIEREGFWGGWGDWGYGVYLFGTLVSAREYARKGGWDGSLEDPVILEIELPRGVAEQGVVEPTWPNPEDYKDIYYVPLEEKEEPELQLGNGVRRIAEALPEDLSSATWVPVDSLYPTEPLEEKDPSSINDIEDQFYKAEGWPRYMGPLTVTPVGDGLYLIEDGHHRWFAAQRAGLGEVPVVIERNPWVGRFEEAYQLMREYEEAL